MVSDTERSVNSCSNPKYCTLAGLKPSSQVAILSTDKLLWFKLTPVMGKDN